MRLFCSKSPQSYMREGWETDMWRLSTCQGKSFDQLSCLDLSYLYLLHKKYCSKECQRIHWPLHKAFCQSPLTKETWLPKYVDENRCPDWLDDDKMSYWTNSSWGHLPAFDSLKLSANEGNDWNKDLDLCFVGASPSILTSQIS